MLESIRFGRTFAVIAPLAIAAATVLAPTSASAQMTCVQVRDWLVKQPGVCTAAQSKACPESITMIDETQTNPRCELTFTYSGKAGTKDGYEADVNTRAGRQLIVIRVGLPRNTAETAAPGAGGVVGAWNGKIRNYGGGGLAGNLRQVTAATNGGYVGSHTDTGHDANQDGVNNNADWGIIPAANKLNEGKINDYRYASMQQQVLWSKKIAAAYYGAPAQRNYWDGCSTGGRQALALAQSMPEEFDGILAGAPGIYQHNLRLADGWPFALVRDKLTSIGQTLTQEQLNATNQRAVMACADPHTIGQRNADGTSDTAFASDPRTCKYNAEDNICGRPNASRQSSGGEPWCLTPEKAAVINAYWAGPRNKHGHSLYYEYDRGLGFPPVDNVQIALNQNHRTRNFDRTLVHVDEASAAADKRPGSTTFEKEFALSGKNSVDSWEICADGECKNPDLTKASKSGVKILMWHGLQDVPVRWRLSEDFYTKSARYFSTKGKDVADYEALQPWFQYFLVPGMGHCNGGRGPQVVDSLFDSMVAWVEKGTPPTQSIVAAAYSTDERPLCPFPQTAVYNGGPRGARSSYACGGNLQTDEAICLGLKTAYGEETADRVQAPASVAAKCGFKSTRGKARR